MYGYSTGLWNLLKAGRELHGDQNTALKPSFEFRISRKSVERMSGLEDDERLEARNRLRGADRWLQASGKLDVETLESIKLEKGLFILGKNACFGTS